MKIYNILKVAPMLYTGEISEILVYGVRKTGLAYREK